MSAIREKKLHHSTLERGMNGIKTLRSMVRFLLMFSLPLAVTSCGGEGRSAGGTAGAGIVASLELEAAYPEAFSYLSGVRELPDGRLLAADPLSQVLLRVDLDAGAADTLGRVGGGPEEYRQPDHVFPLPGDSSLLVDLGKTYLTVVAPDGTFQGGMSMALTTEDGPPAIIMPEAVDGTGRLYSQGMMSFGEGPSDSLQVSRYDRATGESETVASLWRTEPIVSRSGNNVSMTRPRMVANDDYAVGADGRVAVVRANGYFVEWHMPSGDVVTGPETPYEVIPISHADKEADLAESTGAGLGISIMRDASGGTQMQMQRGGFGGGGGEGPSVEEETWGENFPPFRNQRTVVSPANDVWVLRWLPADREPMMDVFGPDGGLKGSVIIPRGRRLIGFGEGPEGADVAYFVRTDEVDLQWLERYRVIWG
ncbi:MAG: hypothetical protein PVJ76_00295 [Gemmatimonadota bacterium]|jgi:hypothetical protein